MAAEESESSQATPPASEALSPLTRPTETDGRRPRMLMVEICEICEMRRDRVSSRGGHVREGGAAGLAREAAHAYECV